MVDYKLMQSIEGLQSDADMMAYRLVFAGKLARVQSVCEFNIFWLSEVSPLIVAPETVDFMTHNLKHIKRKLTVNEFLDAEFIIKCFRPENWNEFKKIFQNYSKKTKIMNSLKNHSENVYKSK
jgi:hypothetical protein